MAIKPEQQYPGKITSASVSYPLGSARNVTTPGDGTGTPLEKAWVNDLFGFQQAILKAGNVTATGSPDTATSSQYLAALRNIFISLDSNLLARVTSLENKVYQDISVNQLLWVEQHFSTPAEVAAWKGYGTWERALKGRVAVGFSDLLADPDAYKTVGAEFGANTHTLSEAEMPSHKHAYSSSHEGGSSPSNDPDGYFSTNSSGPVVKHEASQPDGSHTYSTGVGNNLYENGGDQPHNNIQPSKTLDCWKRVA